MVKREKSCAQSTFFFKVFGFTFCKHDEIVFLSFVRFSLKRKNTLQTFNNIFFSMFNVCVGELLSQKEVYQCEPLLENFGWCYQNTKYATKFKIT